MIKQINVGVIGTGWCGGIRANACNSNPLVDKLYIAETNEDRLNELKLQTWMTDVRSDSIHQIEKFQSKIHNINIDDNRFKVLNN